MTHFNTYPKIRFPASEIDPAILLTLFDHGDMETYVIRNWLDSPETLRFHRVGLKTSHVLTALRRMEKNGEVFSRPSPYQRNMIRWGLTEYGRDAAKDELTRRR